MSSRATCAAIGLVLLASVAAVGAAEPGFQSREIPPDRGRLYFQDKELRRQLALLANAGKPLEQRIAITGILGLTRETRVTPFLIKLVTGDVPEAFLDPRRNGNFPIGLFCRLVHGNAPIDLRVAALWALGETGDPRGSIAFQHALRGIYLKQPEWQYKKGVTLQDGKTISLRTLCEDRLAHLSEPLVKKFADFILEPIVSGTETVSPLAGARKEREDDGKRRAALVSLAAVGDRDFRAVKTLCDVLRANDGYFPWDFKIIAAQALSNLVKRRREELKAVEARDKMADTIAEAFTEAAIITELPEVREVVGWTLRQMGWADRAGATLAEVLAQPHIPKLVRYHAIEALAFIQSKVAADELMFLLYDEDRNVKWRAAITLGAIGDPRALPYLRKLTRDRDPFVRTKVVAALGHLQAPSALAELAVAIDDPDFRVRREAALAIGRIGRPAGIPALLRALEDPRPSVRSLAIIALGYIGHAKGLNAVPAKVADPEPGVRRVAVEVLAQFRNPKATLALVEALADSDSKVRQAARHNVEERLAQQPKDTLGPLIQAIAKGKGEGRVAALECIDADYHKAESSSEKTRSELYKRYLADTSAPLAKALITALADSTPKARLLAGKVLRDVACNQRPRNREILQRVAALAQDPDRNVRNVGVWAQNILRNLPR